MIWNYTEQKILCFKKRSSTNAKQAWLIKASGSLLSNLKQKGNLKEEREILGFFMWVSVMGWLMFAVLNKPVTQREII